MYSPIRACEVEAVPCEAHVIPNKLKMSGVTVTSEKKFDNESGTRNDSVLIRHVQNAVGELKDVEVAFYDENMEVMVHRNTVRAKATVRPGPDGPREGQIYLDHLGDDLKERVGLGIGTRMFMKLYSPDQKEQARIGFSMLHSAYLTMCHHFGRDYVALPEVGFLRTLLQEGVKDPLPPMAMENGARVFQSGHNLLRIYHPQSLEPILTKSFETTQHPVWKLKWNFQECFVVLLKYHEKYLTTCLLPGLGTTARANWVQLTHAFAVQPSSPANGTLVVYEPDKQHDLLEFWNQRVTIPPHGQAIPAP